MIPKIPSSAVVGTLPSDMPLGYYISPEGYTIVLTTHLTQFGVRLQPQILSISTQQQKIGISQTAPIIVTGGVAAAATSFTTTSRACSVNAQGLVTGLAAGKCDLQATQPASGRYLATSSNLYSIQIVSSKVAIKVPVKLPAKPVAKVPSKAIKPFLQITGNGKNSYRANFNFGVIYANKSISITYVAPTASLTKIVKSVKLDRQGAGSLVISAIKGSMVQASFGNTLLGAQTLQ
jgi:hypothetical protein